MELSDLTRYIEALLFVAEGPVALEDLARILNLPVDEVERGVQGLAEAAPTRGLTVQRSGRRLQLVTAADAAPFVERFLGVDGAGKLSTAALETLAIVAYRQPITRAQVDAIRGVNSDGVLRSLVSKSLICPVGRMEQVGRPLLYGTTFEFLQYFGIQSLEELPSLPTLPNPGQEQAAAAEAPQPSEVAAS